jgi:butyryl-CoA dehydrogenase
MSNSNPWHSNFSFDLTEEEKMIWDTVREFAKSEVLPLAEKIDKEHYFPKELIPKMSSLGFMGAYVPAEYGGSDLSQFLYCLIIEELAFACASTSIIVSAHNSLCITPILDYGSVEQKKKYLSKLATGEWLGCFSLSEPGTGSDAASLTCTYTKHGDEYVINGTKNWITNGPQADVTVLFATGDKTKGYKGVTAFVHELNIKGVSRGKPEDKLGIRGSGTCSLNYDQVVLTKENLLFEEGKGFNIAMHTLNGGRMGVAAQAIGIAKAAIRDALSYSNQRKTFGKLINEHQSIQNYFAEMICRCDAARYLNLSAAKLKDSGKPYARHAAMAKLYASEAAMYCADKGIQIHGGYGFVTDYPAERHLRDAKICEIYEGTSEIQKMVIASHLVKEFSENP